MFSVRIFALANACARAKYVNLRLSEIQNITFLYEFISAAEEFGRVLGIRARARVQHAHKPFVSYVCIIHQGL